jgi:DNA-binding transcriptional regulator YhcF (GntR family)
MVIELDFASDTPIYVQLRNQIVKGIGKGELKAGEKLPTVRQLASDAGVNTMTVNKTFVAENINMDIEFREKLESELELLSAEASITGMDKEEFLKMCENIYSKMNPCAM